MSLLLAPECLLFLSVILWNMTPRPLVSIRLHIILPWILMLIVQYDLNNWWWIQMPVVCTVSSYWTLYKRTLIDHNFRSRGRFWTVANIHLAHSNSFKIKLLASTDPPLMAFETAQCLIHWPKALDLGSLSVEDYIIIYYLRTTWRIDRRTRTAWTAERESREQHCVIMTERLRMAATATYGIFRLDCGALGEIRRQGAGVAAARGGGGTVGMTLELVI